jgi:hypothetical protein
MYHRRDLAHVVDGDDVDVVGVVLPQRSIYLASDAAEAVDPDLDCHDCSFSACVVTSGER